MKKGMTRALANFQRKMSKEAGQQLICAALLAQAPFAEQAAAAGGILLPAQPPTPRKVVLNPFAEV